MSIYGTIGSISDNDPCGPPWEYQGSTVTPREDGPRGGEISLAQIPSHITADGRDDQPEDGTPWPWLRVSADQTDVVINPQQARHLADQLTGWADDTEPEAGHRYLSTGCLHGEHGYCQAHTGQAGIKAPARCKFCAAPCICPCHNEAKEQL